MPNNRYGNKSRDHDQCGYEERVVADGGKATRQACIWVRTISQGLAHRARV